MYIQVYLNKHFRYVYPLLIFYEILDTYLVHIFCIVFSGLDMHMYMHILDWVLGFLGFFLTSYTLLRFRVFKVSSYELRTMNRLSITSCSFKQAFYCILLFWKGFWHTQTPKCSNTQALKHTKDMNLYISYFGFLRFLSYELHLFRV